MSKSDTTKFVEIAGYEGLYSVSQLGQVFSIKKNIVLRTGTSTGGYRKVKLYIDGVVKSHSVHRLVALTFLPNPNNYAEVNHKSGDKSDNSVENLEWTTRLENVRHSYRELGRKTLAGHLRHNAKPVYATAKDGNIVGKWRSIHEASRATKVPVQSISKCLIETYRSAGGFKWYVTKKVGT